jgi:selenocysteine lyase/cysteine desulfurase
MTTLRRRTVLTACSAGAAVGVAGLVAAIATGRDASDPTPAGTAAFDPHDWASVKAQFLDATGYARFAAFVFSAHPAPVRAAVQAHRAGLDADPLNYLRGNEERLDAAVAQAAAAYLQRPAEEIAFTDSTTMSLGVLYGGLTLAPGDEVVSTTHDFYSTFESLRLRAVRDGIVVKRIALYDNAATASIDQIVTRLIAQIRPRTRVVAVTWVHSSTGVKLPIRAIADALAALNRQRSPAERVLLCVDGVHGFGVEGTTPDALGCDFLATGTHKWLFGPRGTGLLWGKAWDRFRPGIPTFANAAFEPWWDGKTPALPPGPANTPGGYHSFEHRWAVADAFALHAAIGPDRIARRTHELATMLKSELISAGLGVVTPVSPELSSGIVCVQVDQPPGRWVQALRTTQVIASATPYAQSYLRFGPSIATDEADITRAVAAIKSLK